MLFARDSKCTIQLCIGPTEPDYSIAYLEITSSLVRHFNNPVFRTIRVFFMHTVIW